MEAYAAAVSSSSTGRSRGRRLLFGALVALGVWLVAEAGAFVAFRISDGEAFSPERIRLEQLALAVDAGIEPGDLERGTTELTPIEAHAVHPYLGFVFDPSQGAANARPGARNFGPVSDWGFSDTATPVQKRSRSQRIVGILGGSMAREFGHRGTDALRSALAELPYFAGREIVFVRLGLDGYKQPQQLVAVAYLLSLGAEFDVLVNLDGFNEVALHEAGNGRKGVFPAYPRAWATRAERLPDLTTLGAMGRARVWRDWRGRVAWRLSDSPLHYSPLAGFLWRAADSWMGSQHARAQQDLAEPVSDASSYTVTGPPHASGTREELYEHLTEVWRSSSLQLDRLARANGIHYFHFLQPNQYVADSKPMGAAELRVAVLPSFRLRPGAEAGYPLLVRKGETLVADGVAFRDLTGVFRDVQEPVYRDECCHVNERGNTILAREMAAFIAARLAESEARLPSATDG
jgi:hypothetical protein